MSTALPRVVPAYSSFLCRSKGQRRYPIIVPMVRSNKASSSIPIPRFKANQTAFDIMRTISEKDDGEIQVELIRLQNACKILTGILGSIGLVLMAANPLMQRISDALNSNNGFVCCSSIGASYGALIVLRELVKVLCKSEPTWGFIVVGFLIYKANMCNIALHGKGRYPVWMPPLFVIIIRKLFVDFALLKSRSHPDVVPWAPLIWVSIEFLARLVALIVKEYLITWTVIHIPMLIPSTSSANTDSFMLTASSSIFYEMES